MRTAALLTLIFSLLGCGFKGPLYLPQEQVEPPSEQQ